MNTPERKEITLDELQAIKKQKPTGTLADLKVQGVVTIFDKDGNVKSKLKITSLKE